MQRLSLILFSLTIAAFLLLMGPMFPMKPQPSSVEKEVAAAEDLDLYLRQKESSIEGLKPDLAKLIIWRNPMSRDKTPISLIYLHGFSASRGEISPVMETLAREVGANLFFTRLKGHGLETGDALGDVNPQSWIEDAREALAIGRRLGERVVFVGLSTGATLALHLAVENAGASDIAGFVLISPNHDVSDGRAKFLSGPLGRVLARVALGREREFPVENDRHTYLWTSRYRSEAIASLMDLTNYVRTLDLSRITVPVLTLYTKKDTVVDVALIESRHAEIGSKSKWLEELPGATRHEFAGHALAPEGVRPTVDRIEEFLKTLR